LLKARANVSGAQPTGRFEVEDFVKQMRAIIGWKPMPRQGGGTGVTTLLGGGGGRMR
jgi:hypothetical protein